MGAARGKKSCLGTISVTARALMHRKQPKNPDHQGRRQKYTIPRAVSGRKQYAPTRRASAIYGPNLWPIYAKKYMPARGTVEMYGRRPKNVIKINSAPQTTLNHIDNEGGTCTVHLLGRKQP